MMNPYDSYSSTNGHFWESKIPSEWMLVRIGSVFTERNEIVSDKDYAPLSVTKKGIFPQWENVAKTDSHDNRKLVLKNDFVINSRSDRRGSSGLSNYDGSVSLINIVLKPSDSIVPMFSEYIFKSYEFINEFYKNGRGIVDDLWSTKYSLMKNIYISLPPLPEQQKIGSFLDHRTQKIDELIEKTEKKIELLKENRTCLINHCVTKGLDPNVEMKESGVEWIGEIPSHWEVRRVATFGTFSKGRGINKDEIKTSGIPCIRYGEIYTEYDRIVFDTVSFIDEKSSQRSELVKKGDVLFTGSGETIDEIGKTVVYYGDDDIFIGGDVIILKLKDNLNPLFISYMMNSKYVNHQKSSMGRGEIIVHIYSKQLKEIKTTIPPFPDQHQIAEYLDTKTQEIDSTTEKETQRIELLKEYRQSLISEVVTGKIDVRDEVVV